MKIKAEYIWIDGQTPTAKLRSKTKVMEQGTAVSYTHLTLPTIYSV